MRCGTKHSTVCGGSGIGRRRDTGMARHRTQSDTTHRWQHRPLRSTTSISTSPHTVGCSGQARSPREGTMAAETRVAWFCEKHGVRHDWMVVMMPGAPHFCTKGCEKPMEPVMVLPVAEYNALMAREIDWERYNVLDNDVDRLRRLEDAVRAAPEGFADIGSYRHYLLNVLFGVFNRAARDGGVVTGGQG